MIKAQKIIKYFAIGFAIFLIVDIISLIMYGIISLGTLFDNQPSNNISNNLENAGIFENINNLDIDIISSNIIIKEGNILKIETNNKYIKLKENNNQLSITEEKHNWLNTNDTSNLVIYIPSNYTFDNISLEIDAGVGALNLNLTGTIDDYKIILDKGLGNATLDGEDMKNSTYYGNGSNLIDIDGGVGNIKIKFLNDK